ncbi:hypothetical protein FS837_009268 [Tulasnella sp. UAMH 9824]|nr:hypothetical protein FS837_009268 [Tulasnella sp. UAMH 9824]
MPSINILPYDVLQIIITSCREEKGESFALTASHVCRWWRRHVLDMPLLWNRLEFATRVPQWDMLETKLERSGRAPLDIIVKEEVFRKSGMPHLRRIMRIIVPHIERWRSLRIVDVPHKIRRVLLDQLRGKALPGLNRVEVVQEEKSDRRSKCRKIKSTSRHWDPRKIFDGLPNLRHLEWTNPKAEYRLLPPFRNLHSLKMGSRTLEIEAGQFIQLVFRILSESPALQVLSLHHGHELDQWHIENPDLEGFVQPPTIHLSLQRLHIVASLDVRSVIVRSLILPKLRSLGEPILYTDINVPCCKALAQSGSASNLRAVLITGTLDRLGGYVTLHPHMPSFPSAIMAFQRLVALVFRFIDFGGDNKWLPNLGQCCPDLKSLSFLLCTGYTVKAIQAIVEMRMKREEVESLEELRICAFERGCTANDEEAAWFSQVVAFDPTADDWWEINGED